jgi:hypothetical protein
MFITIHHPVGEGKRLGSPQHCSDHINVSTHESMIVSTYQRIRTSPVVWERRTFVNSRHHADRVHRPEPSQWRVCLAHLPWSCASDLCNTMRFAIVHSMACPTIGASLPYATILPSAVLPIGAANVSSRFDPRGHSR